MKKSKKWTSEQGHVKVKTIIEQLSRLQIALLKNNYPFPSQEIDSAITILTSVEVQLKPKEKPGVNSKLLDMLFE